MRWTLPKAVDLVGKVKRYNPKADCALLTDAYAFAASAHEGQKRKSGAPYFVHPVAVASIITDLRLDVPSVCAGLLHDCVEDTSATTEDLSSVFSSEVAFLVDGVTKLGRVPWTTREERQAENFRKMLLAMARDIRVILIKLADRTDNMRTLEFMSLDGQQRIARETMEIYAPLANRLGIYWLRAELEDLAFRYLYPNEYQLLCKSLAATDKERRRYIRHVERTLRRLMAGNGIECEVGGRPKNLWGIYNKMRANGRDLDQIHDIVAFRVIGKSIRDCYGALGVVHEHFTPIPGRFKDYVAMPKPNGYQSLHSSLIGPEGERMEVQIRTQEMHRVAEEGIAAHWTYKEGHSLITPEDQKKFHWLRQLVEFHQDLKDPAEFIDAVKIDLFADEVYVFTPRGDVKAYPRGATPIDFAYSIHTDIGNRCAGARVNGLIVPLRHKLQNGDTIEIITNPSQRPNKDWLKFVVTARARAKIRHFIRTEQRERGRTLGKELVDRALRKHGLSLNKLQKRNDLAKAATALRVGNSADDLFMQVGFGKVTATQVVRTVRPQANVVEPPVDGAVGGALGRLFPRRRRDGPSGILVQGQDDVLVRFAQCCTPLPGDAVSGFITRGRGVTVHRLECPRGLDLDPERRVEVSWDGGSKVEHAVAINVHSADMPGILANVSKSFAEQGVNISQADCRVDAGRAVNTFHFRVSHLDHLKQVMRAIQRIEGVFSVERV